MSHPVRLILLLILLCSVFCHANTEILSFSLADPPFSELPTLSPFALNDLPQLPFNTLSTFSLPYNSSPHFIQLPFHRTPSNELEGSKGTLQDLLAWIPRGRTIRLCWSASQPTSFDLRLHPHPTNSSNLIVLSISAKSTAIPFPPHPIPTEVRYTLLFEPTYLGIPESVGPIVMSLVGVIAVVVILRIPVRVGDWLGELAKRDENTTKID